jgi:hypothetical protein
MLLHLPIVVLATLSPMTISDTVPRLDVAKECRFEGGSSPRAIDRCSRDEAEALRQLKIEWPQFVQAVRKACYEEATIDGLESYVEFLICLEMARDAPEAISSNSSPELKSVRRAPVFRPPLTR